MAKRRGGSRSGYRRKAPEAPVQAAPAKSGAMAALAAQVEEVDRRDRFRHKDFEMKPRAVRKFEKYASMGEE